jgi:hypothetical protein
MDIEIKKILLNFEEYADKQVTVKDSKELNGKSYCSTYFS